MAGCRPSHLLLRRVSRLLPGLLLVATWTIAGCGVCGESERSAVTGPQASAVQLVSLSGERFSPFQDQEAKAFAFIFTCTDCPIANRYAPEINRLQEHFVSQGVSLSLVYPNASDTPERIAAHLSEYQLTCLALRDPQLELVALAQVERTPEAAVFDSTGKLVYHGRIDNRYVDFGTARREPTQHDLQDAIDATLRGVLPRQPTAPPVGCPIAGDM